MMERSHPRKLFVEVTTRCNLRCGMCVKQNGAGGIPEGSMAAETFERLAPAFSRLESLVLNGIGEPLLHSCLEDFIRRARTLLPDAASIGFQSNGMALTAERAASLVDAGLDRICLSLDAVSDEGFRSIRSGGERAGVVAAFENLNKARAGSGNRGLRTGIEFVLMRDNLAELPAALRWAGRAGASFAIVTQLLPYHRDIASQAAYDTSTDAAVVLYSRWKSQAEREGLDIRRYLDTLTKVRRTPEEERIVQLVGAMKRDADAQGVTLHLDRLLRRDEALLASAEEALEAARRVALEEGVELTLPALTPRNARKCEFVEGDSAFVSWDGNVHPCYFLWHHYACYVGGIEKRVRPWAFGNLRDRGILDIWNGADSLSFRERVREYKFPFCFDCSFALCDYTGDEEFEQDCYIERVPCGACLWCTGLFHCLQ